jgi:hypothetical protein
MALASTVNQEEDFFIADMASITLVNGLQEPCNFYGK